MNYALIAAALSAVAAFMSAVTLWILSDLRDRIKEQEKRCDRRIERGLCNEST